MGLFGNSLGTLICLRCADEEVETMVLMGALTHSMNYDWEAFFPKEKMEELARDGVMRLASETGGVRLLDQQMLRDFEEIDQQRLLEPVGCPVLLIHGDHPEDEEEETLLGYSRSGMRWLPGASRLVVIEGARHGCAEHMDRVVEETVAWFGEHMGVSKE
jgi:pimeloyl-ACP methyl ester carboxylesterase